MTFNTLKDRIQHKRAVIGIIGAGYVGLPLAVDKARKGFRVLVMDHNANRVLNINMGASYLPDVPSSVLSSLVRKNRISASTSLANAAQCDVVLICVPTPLTKDFKPDLSHIRSVVKSLSELKFQGKLVVLESTTSPGTTRWKVAPFLKGNWIAYSPERVNPASQHPTWDIPRVVGGMTLEATRLTAALFRHLTKRVVVVDTPEIAEMSKLFENTFRFVNINLCNEFAMVCRDHGINPWQMLEAAYTKPYSVLPHWPGLIGGHCIPVDPYYLPSLKSFPTVQASQWTHRQFLAYVADRYGAIMTQGSDPVISGLTYKPNVPDDRESPAYLLRDRLQSFGHKVSLHDPLIGPLEVTGREIILLIKHDGINYRKLFAQATLIFDVRNALRDWKDPRVQCL